MKIIYLGTPEHSAQLLSKIIRANFNVAAVITQPDSPKGRGLKLSPPLVKQTALKHNIPVYQPQKLTFQTFNEVLTNIQSEPTIAVVFAFGQILPEDILNLPTYGFINLHLSLLPRWRGPAPVHWTILAGDKEAGATVQKVAFKVDTGAILTAKKIPLDGTETAGTLLNRLTGIGFDLICDVLSAYEKGTPPQPIHQDESFTTYAPKLKKTDARINWSNSAQQIERFIRALNPKPVAFTELKTKSRTLTVRIFKSTLTNKSGLVPGKLLYENRKLLVGTADFSLELNEVQPASRRVLSAAEFAAGYLRPDEEAYFA